MHVLTQMGLLALLAPVGAGANVTATPLFWAGQKYPGFVVRCTNASGRNESKLEYIRKSQALRLDGVLHERTGVAGSFVGSDEIPDGGSFTHVVFIGEGPPHPADLVRSLGDYVSWSWSIPVDPGRHSVSFRCGSHWSDEVGFVWTR